MQCNADQLTAHLQRKLMPVYLITGDEPLFIQECADAVRKTAHAQGFSERRVMTVESGFDWAELYNATRSLSLFSERRLLELRLPTGKPGEAGAKVLVELASDPPADMLLLVTTGKLDRQQRETKWAKALGNAGALVTVYPIEAPQLPGWIARRMRARGLKPGPGMAELLAHYMEGNLLACAQEIDKLVMLRGQSELGVDDIENMLCDNARFNVFGLADTCLRGEARAVVRILKSLRAEGVAPVLVLWALAREVRELVRMSQGVEAGQSVPQVIEAHRVWQRRKPLVRQALTRQPARRWQALLAQAARVDRVIKGRQSGDAWRELQCLALEIAGVRTLSDQAASA